ncbi:sarcalumenin isoform X1 [Colias croceus]|uniref:sarcalumenin isoform X1 n=2 Tax=Colias crocea TaxID=72248 RepID=UPI001E27D4BA|nr:sarcalumenin isoform X1 [Colias croceus]XP_045503967.1 sarcalumenin isoform X1 [Colias croceus]XP_045503968.1 sarcalumenin isoform X1 [Colias croceus]XP_045503969.1 sarcalumenin isoform X1 [Colias croceus]
MWTKRLKLWRYLLCMLFAVSTLALAARADDDVPLESQCRPYIEKALKELESGDTEPDTEEKQDSSEISIDNDTKEDISTEDGAALPDDDSKEQADSQEVEDAPSVEVADEPYMSQVSYEDEQEVSADNESKEDNKGEENETGEESAEQTADEGGDSKETASADEQEDEKDSGEEIGQAETQEESTEQSQEEAPEDDGSKEDTQEDTQDDTQDSKEGEEDSKEEAGLEEESKEGAESEEAETASLEEEGKAEESEEASQEEPAAEQEVEEGDDSKETKSEEEDGSQEKPETDETVEESQEVAEESQEEGDKSQEEGDKSQEEGDKSQEEEDKSKEEEGESVEQKEESQEKDVSAEQGEEDVAEKSEETDAAEGETEGGEEGQEPSEEAASEEEAEGAPEEDLLLTGEIPENLRSRDHIIQILRLDEEASESELIIEKSADIVLRDLKRVYENSIKPLEGLYKYRDLSNRHFGDPEIFSKPLVLFMGPWSGGKSSILNYLTGLEFTEWSLRTGAEPSPAYFNILMHGKDPEVLDGTQLAADWTFSGLQKFGQGLEERLRGLKYPSKLLEKVNIVEIPGILEVRKQVSRVFPFNDACQWFIDRADIIFLVYDPSKLDVGPETEAILDQLKGRESQTRIVLNKADSVKPEELMRVQSALIWNISPLMSSPQPPVMYTVSLWSIPFEATAPVRLLQAQERELLRDLRQAVDKRIENKIASARRFAVRVRNHAKMVDCYLTTYYNHKTIFGNRKLIADAIIENPQNYHIYEGLSTLTNISRYDLPDPETYRDFFRLNPLYEFQQLSATCTYFRGCPINKLDVAIAYDLPELVGKYKKMVETATPQGMPKS